MPKHFSFGIHRYLRTDQLVLGKSSSRNRLPRSITQTEYPFSASRIAATLPPNPEPTTMKSYSGCTAETRQAPASAIVAAAHP